MALALYVYISQAKPEHSSSHARSCVCKAFSELFSGIADHRMIDLSVARLIMQSRLLQCYITTLIPH